MPFQHFLNKRSISPYTKKKSIPTIVLQHMSKETQKCNGSCEVCDCNNSNASPNQNQPFVTNDLDEISILKPKAPN